MNAKNYVIQLAIILVLVACSYVLFFIDISVKNLEPAWGVIASEIVQRDGTNIIGQNSLTSLEGSKVVFRLWIAPSFDTNKVITIDLQKDKSLVEVIEFSSVRDFEVIKRTESKLDAVETAALYAEIKQSGFLFTQYETQREIGIDGTMWTLEAYVNGKYLRAKEWSPMRGSLHEIGLSILHYSNVR